MLRQESILFFSHGIERLLATPWTQPHAPQTRHLLTYLNEQEKEQGIAYFIPLCSHDSPSAAEVYGGEKSLAVRYIALTVLGSGCSGIVQGSEWAQKKKIEFIGEPEKIRQKATYEKVFTDIHAVLEIIGPFTDAPIIWHDENHDALLCGERETQNGRVIVIANFDTGASHILGVPTALTSNYKIILSQGCTTLSGIWQVDAGGFEVYFLRK